MGPNGARWDLSNRLRIFTPSRIALDSAGRIYFVDILQSKGPGFERGPRIIRVDDISGKGWMEFGEFGTGVRQFRWLRGGIAVDSAGRIYVADPGNNRIVRVDSIAGNGWVTFEGKGLGKGKFSPNSIAVDSADRIYVDVGRRIGRMNNITGAGWKSFGAEELGLKDFVPSQITVVPSPQGPK